MVNNTIMIEMNNKILRAKIQIEVIIKKKKKGRKKIKIFDQESTSFFLIHDRYKNQISRIKANF